MAVKVAGVTPWSHHIQIKKAEAIDADVKWTVSGLCPIEMKVSWGPGSLHSLPYYLLLNLVFYTMGMNTDSASNPHCSLAITGN